MAVRVVPEGPVNQWVRWNWEVCEQSEMLDSAMFRDLMAASVSLTTSMGCQVSDERRQR